jgi:hypothetical protein
MRVALDAGNESAVIDFDPDSQNWRSQAASSKFLIGYEAISSRFHRRVFVKRWHGRPADAHRCLIETVGKKIPGTPVFYGYACDGKDHYYFSQNLKASYRHLEDLLSNNDSRFRALLDSKLVTEVVDQSAKMFDCLWSRGYLYTDYSAKNILVDTDLLAKSIRGVAFVDVDSSWPLRRFREQPLPSGAEFDIKFWALWNRYVQPSQHARLRNAPKTFVLSLAAVWSRAIALADGAAPADLRFRWFSLWRRRPNIARARQLVVVSVKW